MLDESIENRLRGLKHIIGNTPLLAIDYTYKGECRTIYAKAEHMNMTGSIKDRMALHILRQGYRSGDLKPGDHIIEATSGNTGISFSGVGRALGHTVSIFMPDWLSKERFDIIRCLGADIKLVSKAEGGFLKSIELADELAACNGDCFLPHQFSNEQNVQAHMVTTGPEIWWQLAFRQLKPDAFVAGVGTGGTVMGIGRYLKGQDSAITVHPLEPASSPTLSTGYKTGSHRIQGISDDFIPAIVKLDEMDDVVSADDGDAILMAQKLSRQLGLAVGISSGANFIGAVKVHNELGPDATVVTVFPDDNKKYLSTDLMNEEAIRSEYLSTDVTLSSFQAINRVCKTCCDPNCTMRGRSVPQPGRTEAHCTCPQ